MSKDTERLIILQIKEVKSRVSPTIFVILGIFGLFFFIIPGIIFFVIAIILSYNKKNRIADLELELNKIIKTGGKKKWVD